MSSVVSRGSSSSVQGRDKGPLRAACEVLAYRRIGAYHSLTFVAPDMAERALPGQFVSVGVKGGGTLLRRAFSIYSVSRHGPWAGTVEIVFDVVGEGTRWMSTLVKHDVVDLVGPLGRGFPMPQQLVDCLLIGGGYGAAPLLFLAQRLQQANLRVDMIMGAASQERLFNAIEAKRLATSALFTTDDGSFGTQGRVTDVMERALDSGSIGVIYACGPMAMLKSVAEVAQRHRLPVQVAVEEAMACSVGVCMTCVVPYKREGQVVNVRSCVEGPVLNGRRIRWDLIGPQPSRDVSLGEDDAVQADA